jgi:hypothetical protein
MLAKVSHLAADKAAGDRIVSAAINLHQTSALYANIQCAQIRAIEWTGGLVNLHGGTSRRSFPKR